MTTPLKTNPVMSDPSDTVTILWTQPDKLATKQFSRTSPKAAVTMKQYDAGYPPAIHTFSVCLERGIGVEKNEQHAFEYCKAAAALGNGAALHNMGCNYVEGRNVSKDSELGLRYFSSAAQKGFVAAMHSSAYVVDMGIGVVADGELALKRYSWAYQNGHTKSANNLGIYFISGRHVTPDEHLAQEWFKKGADSGDSYAMKNLAKLNELMRTNTSSFSDFRKFAKIWHVGDIF